jgi:hypothetical protein
MEAGQKRSTGLRNAPALAALVLSLALGGPALHVDDAAAMSIDMRGDAEWATGFLARCDA